MAVELTDNNNKIKVTYNDGSVVFIKPVPFTKLDIVVSYQELILTEWMKNQFYISSIIYKDSPTLNAIKAIIKVLPILSDNNEKLNIDKLDTIEDLISLFITKEINRNEHTGQLVPSEKYGTYLPPMISVIHGIDFFSILEKVHLDLKSMQTNG